MDRWIQYEDITMHSFACQASIMSCHNDNQQDAWCQLQQLLLYSIVSVTIRLFMSRDCRHCWSLIGWHHWSQHSTDPITWPSYMVQTTRSWAHDVCLHGGLLLKAQTVFTRCSLVNSRNEAVRISTRGVYTATNFGPIDLFSEIFVCSFNFLSGSDQEAMGSLTNVRSTSDARWAMRRLIA